MKKNNRKKKNIGIILFFSILFLILWIAPGISDEEEKISMPGKYTGYSSEIYYEWVRTSEYVTVRDGTKLAVDIYRPSKDGKPVSEPLPLIWTLTRYHRANFTEDGSIVSKIDAPWLQKILKHGYIVAAVDVRGGGASFGTRRGPFAPEEAKDGYDITEWFAKQPWCDGNIGMYGGSYLAITQYMAAGMAPPHLKAIMPEMAMFDEYSFAYPGGIFQDDFLRDWSDIVKELDIDVPTPPVDDDPQSVLAGEAVKEHKENIYAYDGGVLLKYRDDINENTHQMQYLEWSPNVYVKGINEGKPHTAVYTVAGWYDMWPRDALVWFTNLKVPQKIIITPWSHSSGWQEGWKNTVRPMIGFEFEFDTTAEHLRWYDYWLKGIDNGIMDEPPIYYFTMGAPEGSAWRTSSC